MKKLFYITLLVFILGSLATPVVFAQSNGNIGYTPLEPIPGLTDVPTNGDFSSLIKGFFRVAFSLGALFAVGMITFAGINYMVSDVPRIKMSSLSRLWAALTGLAILAGSYLILNTINPELLEFKFDLNTVGSPATPGGGGAAGDAKVMDALGISKEAYDSYKAFSADCTATGGVPSLTLPDKAGGSTYDCIKPAVVK